MRRLSAKGKIFIGVMAVICVILLARCTSPDRASLSFLEKGTQDVMAPLQNGLTQVSKKASLRFKSIDEVRQENEALKQEIMDLRSEHDALYEAYLENVRLRRLLSMAEEMAEWQPVAAKVIGRDSSGWYNTVTISGGTNMGFAKGMAVINADGLVGRIVSVSGYSSQVLLLTDPECAAAAMVQANRTFGTVEGMAGSLPALQMIHIPGDTLLEAGQTVITSGLGEIFPAGLR
ncbi:MAG: rod shape-determining protein MreC, partial [Clostridiales bacterium]|nr:rod shape-determining protein MreC [Clostridiales bacterium]